MVNIKTKFYLIYNKKEKGFFRCFCQASFIYVPVMDIEAAKEYFSLNGMKEDLKRIRNFSSKGDIRIYKVNKAIKLKEWKKGTIKNSKKEKAHNK